MRNLKVDRVSIINKATGISYGNFSITQFNEAVRIADNWNDYHAGDHSFDVVIDNVRSSVFDGQPADLTYYEEKQSLQPTKKHYKYSAQL